VKDKKGHTHECVGGYGLTANEKRDPTTVSFIMLSIKQGLKSNTAHNLKEKEA